jgi:DNA-binding CsgD family transcriptional regulator
MRRKNYTFKYNEYMLERIMKSPYILNSERKEKDILKLTLKGKSCSQIADIIGYSERTIQSRRKDIYNKTLQFM